MRSTKGYTISSGEVHRWALEWLSCTKLLKDHGWLCTAVVVWNIVLRAAARCLSVSAACRDLSKGPCGQSVLGSLDKGLPKTWKSLDRKVNEVLTADVPRQMRRRAWELAIDWHLSPYYGQPEKSRNELYYGKPRQGTKNFHAYATACIITHGYRYTVALTWVRRHETVVTVLRRLIAQIRKIGLKIRRVLLDRAFFSIPVVQFLQAEKLPFVMPVVMRGKKPRRGKPLTGLRWIQRQAAGWYTHVMKHKKQEARISVCVGFRRHRNRKDGKQVHNKLLFAAWRVKGTPVEIRELYRRRFGIETSYRQMRQARIYTCTPSPRLRFVFVMIALLLRNLWVWIHQTRLAEGSGESMTLHLERLRFKRLLDWIVHEIVALYHDGSKPYVAEPP